MIISKKNINNKYIPEEAETYREQLPPKFFQKGIEDPELMAELYLALEK